MGSYEVLKLIGEILLIAYLVGIPWTIGMWMWLPLCTGLGALVVPVGILMHSPHVKDPAKLHQAHETWANHVLLSFAYLAYYIVAIGLSMWLQMKWFDRSDRKDLERKQRDQLRAAEARKRQQAIDLGMKDLKKRGLA